ncbi:engulfment and cell motility protein 1 isoform X2 [Neodiprion pinetum]|uniref:Engulfment and cell motility protein 1 isoform X2 n=1 Tax=Neodiprion lecontei TaxID=441921 RepID=A0ABM3FRJ3_NEOLC|nr:engulfment and cell motility protein 1 isoform X2 [Neodiprion fabricii]XP_046475119.1 engulfment and cell motility protein 1 isoform X2 [Neodiprion pinetum]XP_046590648.1 engulfment and cell motility protein 1 isoform X2 [Neodiprion lecontei]XP_046611158.1 engulfment and cell motility protein 1 isoform X2 [Neodiprion virginianus]
MYTKTIKMPATKDSNIVKIAIEMADQQAQLIEFNQKQPLTGIIQELCNAWDLSDPDTYALQFSDNNHNYITEKNRNEIKNGSILRLEHSPSKTASDILAKLNNGNNDEKVAALQKLSTLSNDVTFALEFINKQGLALIISQVGSEMAHQLYVLQTLLLGLLEQRMMTKMDPQDQDALDKIKELRRIAFDTEGSVSGDVTARKQGIFAKDYKKLGFKYDINPAMDFTETPPGMLALDCMVYFARNHVESYTKVVLENSCRADEHECPFGRTSVELVKLLCEVLRIGEAPSEQGQCYHPMFFKHDHPFEEFYCVCIVLLNKTWKEMRATTEDFVKVFSVVKEQITRALQSKPTGLDKFKLTLHQLTYSVITNLWQQERTSREECESHAKPIIELREQITPEIMDLIRQQRLGFLVEGTRFTKYGPRGQRMKDKFRYVRLSPNHKVFHYGECDEKSVPTIDELPAKLAVVEIRALLTGRDCPHMKDLQRRKTTHQLAFSLALDSVEVSSLDFVAPDEQVFDYWTDGINALLGNKMTSKETEKDLETLLSMDIKLRLLDAEGIDIPTEPPPIPDNPPHYDFCYELT